MIEQRENQLLISFPDEPSATAFGQFLSVFFRPVPPTGPLATGDPFAPAAGPGSAAISVPPSEPSPDPVDQSAPSIPDSPALGRSRHVVLTPERQDQLFNQRQSGQSAHQRLLRAQTTLRDGVLPFSRPGETPQPTGQPSPRMRAAAEGGFADGAPKVPALRPAVPADPLEVGRRPSNLRPSPRT